MKTLIAMAGCLLLPVLGAAGEAAAPRTMPTQQELAKAEPLILELMRDDLNAVRSGKKTREQVGDAAVALARQAQTPAEKYLLLSSSFDQYMRGGAYGKASASLAALRAAIPDWKHSDECALVEKALRTVAAGKGGPVRERYEALKARQQHEANLKKTLALVQANPSDKKLQLQAAVCFAVLDRWPQAVDAFLAGANPSCAVAAAAKLEKEAAPPGQVADAWWNASDVKPDSLSAAIRVHAADLYRKALAANSLAGLQKVAAEKRIAEARSLADAAGSGGGKTMSAPGQSSGMAKHYGVELVGGSVKESNGVLGGFAKNSFARIRPKFKPGKETFEVVIEFRTGKSLSGAAGLLSCSGQPGFVPFFLNANRMIGSISSNGKTWDVAANAQYGDALLPQSSYRMRCTWNGSEYEWFVWDKASWRKVLGLRSTTPVFQESQLQLGNHRLGTAPFAGTIDLNKCYICIGGSLWWEGAKGAYRNANK